MSSFYLSRSPEAARLDLIHAFRPPSAQTCFAWCAATPAARSAAEHVVRHAASDDELDDVDEPPKDSWSSSWDGTQTILSLSSAHRTPSASDGPTSSNSVPRARSQAEARACGSVPRGYTCAGLSITRYFGRVSAQDEHPHEHQRLTVKVTEKTSGDRVRALITATAWWLVRLSPLSDAVPVCFVIHGPAALAGFLCAASDASNINITSHFHRTVPPSSPSPSVTLFAKRVTSLRMTRVHGAALHRCAAAALPSPTTTATRDPWAVRFAQLGSLCRHLVRLHIATCDGWHASWWAAIMTHVCPRLTELHLSDFEVTPRIVPIVRAILTKSYTTAESEGHHQQDSDERGAAAATTTMLPDTEDDDVYPEQWALKKLSLRKMHGLTSLSMLRLIPFILFPSSSFALCDATAQRTSAPAAAAATMSTGLLPHLEHFTMENCDLCALHIEDEVRRLIPDSNTSNGSDEDDEDEDDSFVITEAVPQTEEALLDDIRSEIDSAMQQFSPTALLDMLLSWPSLQSFKIVNVTSFATLDTPMWQYVRDMTGFPAATDAMSDVSAYDGYFRNPRLQKVTHQYCSRYPLSHLLAPRECASPHTTDTGDENSSADYGEHVSSNDDDGEYHNEDEEEAASVVVVGGGGARALRQAEVSGEYDAKTSVSSEFRGWNALSSAALLLPSSAYACLVECHIDGVLSTGSRTVNGVVHSGVSTLWRRTLRAVRPYASLSCLRHVDHTIFHDDTSAVPLDDAMLTVNHGMEETAEAAANAEMEAAIEIMSFSWLARSSASLEWLQIVHVVPPVCPFPLAQQSLAESLSTFPRLQHVELHWTSVLTAPSPRSQTTAMMQRTPSPVSIAAMQSIPVTTLIMRDATHKGALAWYDETTFAISQLASLRSLELHCGLLAPCPAATVADVPLTSDANTASTPTTRAAVYGVLEATVASPTPFHSLVRLSLYDFTATHAALLLRVPCYPQLLHIVLAFAPLDGSGDDAHRDAAVSGLVVPPPSSRPPDETIVAPIIPYVDCLLWLTHAPDVTHVELANCRADARTFRTTAHTIDDAAQQVSAGTAADIDDDHDTVFEERWWTRFFAPVLAHPCLSHFNFYGFTGLRSLPEPLARMASSSSATSSPQLYRYDKRDV